MSGIEIQAKREGADHTDFKYGERGFGYIGDSGKIGLTRCGQCSRENYAPSVPSGACIWCGHSPVDDVRMAISLRYAALPAKAGA